MKLSKAVVTIAVGMLAWTSVFSQVVINEIDYDQVGPDNAEFIELKNVSAAAVSLNGYSVELVNGSGGGAVIYTTVSLPNVSLAAGDYFVICGGTTPNCDLDHPTNTDFVQNGAPDAIGLRNGIALVDAVSYEGNTGAPYTEGTGAPVAAADSNTLAFLSLSRFSDGVDTNNNANDLSLRCASPGTANPVAATLCTDPAGFPTISIGSASVIEGTSAGSVDLQVPVTISVAPAVGVNASVNFTTTLAGSASPVSDFTSTSGTLTFVNGGPLTQTINIQVFSDSLDESDETIDVRLATPTNANIGNSQGIGTITDDDVATPSIDDVSLSEGDSGQTAFDFTVTLSGPADSTRAYWVFTSNGSALAPSDYTAIPQSPLTTISFAPGALSQTVTVQVNGDTAMEPDETFTVSVANLPLGSDKGTPVLSSAIGEIFNDDASTVTIADVSQNEGSPSGTTTFTFTATLSAALPKQDCIFGIETLAPGTANDATPGIDYVAEMNLPVTILANSLSQTFTITVNRDTTVEPDEVFDVSAFGEPGGCSISGARARGSIVNDDSAVPTLIIDDVTTLEGTGPGTSSALYTVTLSAQPTAGAPVTVNYSGLSASATLGTDFSLTSGTLTFTNGGPLTQTISVAITRDSLDEFDELYAVILSGASNASILDAKGDGTITDDDGSPVPSIGDISQNEGNAGNTAFVFTVVLSNPSSFQTSFVIFTQNGSASAPGDFTAIAPTLINFEPGQVSRTVTVQVVGDTVTESDENFQLAVGPNDNGVDGNPILDTGTATIVNDDVARELNIDDVSTLEGTGAGNSNALFTVSLSAAPAVGTTVTVNYGTANGTAAAASDYTSSNGTLTFTPAGPLTQVISVTLTRDNIDEGDETYVVNLSGATNALILDNQGVGTIVDDDAAPVPTVSNVSVNEGNAGGVNALFLITLSNPSDSATTYQVFTTNGSAQAPGDYTAIPVAPAAFVTFPPLSTSQSTTVVVQGDSIVEANESFEVNLADAQALVGPDGVPTIVASGTGTINNDDSATLSIAGNSGPEGNSGTSARTFALTLSNPVQAIVQVSYSTVDGTATVADADYQAASGTVNFASLQTSAQTGSVLIVGDVEVEPDQSFSVTLSAVGLPPGVSLGTGTAAAVIVNDDATSASIAGASANEGTGANTTLNFTVSLSAPAKSPVSVQYTTVNGTAVAPSDFTATSGTLNFASGQQTAVIAVTVIGDSVVEPNESFSVSLSNPNGATIATASATGTIVNDDSVSLSINDVTQAEGSGGGMTVFTFTVTASGPSTTPITVNYQTADITAVAPGDYQAASGVVSIPAQALSTSININVVADTLIESNETFRVTLTGTSGATLNDAEGIGTILGDDVPTAVPALDRRGMWLLAMMLMLLGVGLVRRQQ